MPQRTIAAGGGNWNSTSTWVEGAVPTTSDFIVGNASSGQLTINVAASCQYVDFTNYTNTLTMSNTLTLGLASSTNTFGVGMNFAGTSSIICSVAASFTQNTTNRIPSLQFTGTATRTLNTNMNVVNFSNTSGINTLNNNTIFISGNIDMVSAGNINGTTNFHMVGNGTINAHSFNAGDFIINTTGTYTIISRLGIGNNTLNKNITFRHLQGTIINPILGTQPNFGSSITTIDLLAGTTWDFYLSIISQFANINTINFQGTCNFNNFVISNTAQLIGGGIWYVLLQGANLTINNFSTMFGINNVLNVFTPAAIQVRLEPTRTYTINNSFDTNGNIKFGVGSLNPQVEVMSNVASTPVKLNINTFNQYVSRTRFTDVDCSGGNTIYGQDLQLTRTTNIQQYTLPPVSETSSTFIL